MSAESIALDAKITADLADHLDPEDWPNNVRAFDVAENCGDLALDAEDAAESVRLGLLADIKTTEVFNISAADTIMEQTNHELIETAFPGTPILEGSGDHDSMLSIAKAKKMLGYSPRFSWRNRLNCG